MTAKEAPYGTWPSLISAADLVEGAVGLGYPAASGSKLFWEERRPSEAGRVAVVASVPSVPGGDGQQELLPREMSARTTANEYGGRAWAVASGGRLLVSSNFKDQRLWDLSPGGPPRPLTPEPRTPRSVRFASPAVHPSGKWVVAVRETHAGGLVANDLVAVAVDGAGDPKPPLVLAQGRDFYSFPTFSADGSQLAFVCWDHPNMPWDRTELWQAQFCDGSLSGLTPVAGQGTDESVLQPQWSETGDLLYVSDRSGWWNLYCGHDPLAPMEADFAGPPWCFGDSNYAVLSGGTVISTWTSGGDGYLGVVSDGEAVPFDLPYTSFANVAAAPGPSVLAVAAGPRTSSQLVRVFGDGTVEVLRDSQPARLPKEWISEGKHFTFPTSGGQKAHAFYYAPCNPEQVAPKGDIPPLVVTLHGGPTSAASRALQLRVQYWTTRGFSVVDVDYRGSTGYGRVYRQELDGQWGVADVDDCAAAVAHLAREAKADPARVVIRGGSSSGLTALVALARHRSFAGAVVLFPVCDVASLVSSTHNFESRYVERLVPSGQEANRSPLAMVSAIKAPVLIFQGLEDAVVPPDQPRQMVGALRANGAKALLVEIGGEGHGFRKASTLVRVQEAELAFYGEIFGFEPAGDMRQARADLMEADGPGWATWDNDTNIGPA